MLRFASERKALATPGEVRDLDHALAEIGTTKQALRAAMREVLPKTAAERPKLGFPVPIGLWLKGDAYGFAYQLLREAQTDQWLNRQVTLDLLRAALR